MAKLIALMVGVQDKAKPEEVAQNLYELVFDRHPQAQEWLEKNLDGNFCVEYQYDQDGKS